MSVHNLKGVVRSASANCVCVCVALSTQEGNRGQDYLAQRFFNLAGIGLKF